MSVFRASDSPANPERSVRLEAAVWLATLSDEACPPEERKQFAAWLRRANTHVEEFLRISSLTRRLQTLKEWPDIDMPELIAQARAQAKVTTLPGPASGFLSK